jgi:hypothetical protein
MSDDPEPRGELIGVCHMCGRGVGDREWRFGAWDGERWRFSGYGLPGAAEIALLEILLCPYCAVLVEHKLRPAPSPESRTDTPVTQDRAGDGVDDGRDPEPTG